MKIRLHVRILFALSVIIIIEQAFHFSVVFRRIPVLIQIDFTHQILIQSSDFLNLVQFLFDLLTLQCTQSTKLLFATLSLVFLSRFVQEHYRFQFGFRKGYNFLASRSCFRLSFERRIDPSMFLPFTSPLPFAYRGYETIFSCSYRVLNRYS